MNRTIQTFALAAIGALLLACGVGGTATERPNVDATVAAQVQATVGASQNAKPTSEPATDAPAEPTKAAPTEAPTDAPAEPTKAPDVAPTKAPVGNGSASSGRAACIDVPTAPADPGQMSVPAIPLNYAGKVTGFPNASQDALVAQFGDKALVDQVVALETYEKAEPATVAAEYADKLATVGDWKSVLAAPTTPIQGDDRHALLFSDGVTDLFITFEPTAGFPTAETPVSPGDLAEVQQSVAGSQTVRVGYAGKGIAKALCSGALPKLFAPGSGSQGGGAAAQGDGAAAQGEAVAPPGSAFVTDMSGDVIAARYGAGSSAQTQLFASFDTMDEVAKAYAQALSGAGWQTAKITGGGILRATDGSSTIGIYAKDGSELLFHILPEETFRKNLPLDAAVIEKLAGKKSLILVVVNKGENQLHPA